MAVVLHGSARTAARLRSEFQASQESSRTLAANSKTVVSLDCYPLVITPEAASTRRRARDTGTVRRVAIAGGVTTAPYRFDAGILRRSSH